jgi:hypothetical protein
MPYTVRGLKVDGKGMRCAVRRGELCWRQMCLGEKRSALGCSLFESESHTPERPWGPLQEPRHHSVRLHELASAVLMCRSTGRSVRRPRLRALCDRWGDGILRALRVGGDEATNSGVKALQAAVAQAAATSPAGDIPLSCNQPRPSIASGRAVSLRGRASICRGG